jgi:hypothetical protein
MSDTQPTTTSTGRKVPTRGVCTRYGVCDRTIARWERDEKLSFPQPTVINGRKYFDEDALNDWERAHASKARAA